MNTERRIEYNAIFHISKGMSNIANNYNGCSVNFKRGGLYYIEIDGSYNYEHSINGVIRSDVYGCYTMDKHNYESTNI